MNGEGKYFTLRIRKVRVYFWLYSLLVIGILAALAIPDFRKMLKKQSGMPPGRSWVTRLYVEQMEYRARHGAYAGAPGTGNCFELLGLYEEISRRPELRCNIYCGQESILATARDVRSCLPPQLSPVTAESFTIIAVGNIDNDDTCDVWIINEKKELVNLVNDVNE